jgi:hypothetical protein
MQTGFFTMDDVREIEKMKTLTDAKYFAIGKVDLMPEATKENKHKARAAINKAKSVQGLMLTICNFVLAHPSEHLKVIR